MAQARNTAHRRKGFPLAFTVKLTGFFIGSRETNFPQALSNTQPGEQRLKEDFRTTTSGRADEQLARTGSLNGHPSKQKPR
ncbi:hypothetical protein J6590_105496 [Homalodisca vitripennis]|nr:hypothetical protein J6590_105496 [Homalodisca vitripennis]